MVASPVFRFAETAQTATDMAVVDEELTVLLRSFGIDHFVLYQATDRRGRPSGARPCGKKHAEWRKHYEEAGLANGDPLLVSGRSELSPTTWSKFRSGRTLTREESRVFDEAAKFGLMDGFYLPIHQTDGTMHGVSMMVDHELEDDPRMMGALHMLSLYYSAAAHRLGKTTPEDSKPRKPVLTPRQCECLQWVRAGKSSWDIGQILGLSEHTVNEHLAEARKRLGVRTTTQAVIEAIDQGLIHL
jgi:DNA-binding CsgD family transcriptional regulator